MSDKEIIREADVEEEEDECIKKNLKERADLVDKDARVNMKNSNDSIYDEVLLHTQSL